MNRRLAAIASVLTLSAIASFAFAQDQTESVYAPPAPPSPDQGGNQGALHIDAKVNYMTDYIYRGINPVPVPKNSPNLQFDGDLSLDLGKLPHPFVGLFTNINSGDPVNNFEEIRPFFGFDWKLAPFTFTAGDNTYIHPDRSDLDSADVYWQLTFDDSILWHTAHPILSPYIYSAYDYDRYNGWYLQAGLKHDFIFEDIGVILTAFADVAYVARDSQFAGANGDDTGFQHYDIGLTGKYSLNTLLNFSQRYGEWNLVGYLDYTDGIDNALKAKSELWGGCGIELRY